MKILSISLLFFLFVATTVAANEKQKDVAKTKYPTETLYKIWLDQQKDPNAAARFYNGLSEKHIIESNPNDPTTVTVTYFAKGSEETDYIMQSGGPDFYGLRFSKLDGSSIYFCTQIIPSDAWFTYGVNEFKNTPVKGSKNLTRTSMEHVNDGVIVGPDAPLSEYIRSRPTIPKGTLREFILDSEFMGEQRKIEVYVPADYNPDYAHNLILQLDGQNYSAASEQAPAWRGWTPLPTVLDNLIHEQKIDPTIAVFIHNQGNRSNDLISDQMTDFIALEILPWIRDQYSIKTNAKNIVVSGPSRAGFAAANTAFRYSNVIGSVLSQSGSFYYTLNDNKNWPIYPEYEGKLLSNYKHAKTKDIQFYLDVGLYDLGLAAVGTNRQLRDILQLKGYPVTFYQYKGGHSHFGWRHTIASGLVALIGKDKASQRSQKAYAK